jgi:YVTN family beta-propeller protein
MMPVRTLALASLSVVALFAGSAAVAEPKLYVLASAGDAVIVVDVATDRILSSVEVGALPHGIASPASGEVLWITAEGADQLVLLDTRTDQVLGRYPVGRRPNEIDVTSDGRYVYVPVLRDGRYEVFDTAQRKIVARIPTDGFPHNTAASPDGRFIYLAPMDRGGVEVDPEQLRKLGAPMSFNEKIYVVDVATNEVVATVPLADAPRPIAIHPSGDRLFVNRDGLLGFEVIDLEARRVVATAKFELTREERATPSRSHGIVVTPDGREVWSTDINNRAVHVFDVTAAEPREVARLATGATPTWLTITPDGATVYVANAGDDSVSVYDVAAKRQRGTIQMPKGSAPKRCLVVNVPERASERVSRVARAGS